MDGTSRRSYSSRHRIVDQKTLTRRGNELADVIRRENQGDRRVCHKELKTHENSEIFLNDHSAGLLGRLGWLALLVKVVL